MASYAEEKALDEAIGNEAIFTDPAMEAAVRKGKMTMKSVLTEFAEWTAIPGPIQLVYALNTFTVLKLLQFWPNYLASSARPLAAHLVACLWHFCL